jgi:hypothetical protein
VSAGVCYCVGYEFVLQTFVGFVVTLGPLLGPAAHARQKSKSDLRRRPENSVWKFEMTMEGKWQVEQDLPLVPSDWKKVPVKLMGAC